MADIKTAYFIDPDTLLHTYDYVQVSADAKGKFILPENATWVEPKKGENEFYIHARWNPDLQNWEEGGVAVEPAPSAPAFEGVTKEQYLALVKQNIDLTKKFATMQATLSKVLLAQAEATKTQ
ncbi:hypothetical protein CHH91_04655 [Virgibacillus sp. 7505]|uniref:hypothetical protein n=1 Tax=Virgibacillus sp. 7505 TaxID=2022548 RepID=UPI000BA5E36F|nr:hypothetical protein [Virgibacillus sp. 7505]PAE17300.1 hypothetical protein CHH91_04655 [Virgibacillus sp. 7505]